MKEFVLEQIQEALKAYYVSNEAFEAFMESTQNTMTQKERTFLRASIENIPTKTDTPLETIAQLLYILCHIRSQLHMIIYTKEYSKIGDVAQFGLKEEKE